MDITALVNKMVVFLVLMIVGYLGARRGMLNREFTRAASALVLNVFMSCAIINSVLTVDMELSLAELGQTFLVICLSQLICYIVAALGVWPTRLGPDQKPVFELLAAVTNSMFIALPVVDSLFGAQAVFYVSLSCLPFNLLLYTYGIWRMMSGKGKLRVKDMFTVPMIATILSLLIFLLKLPVPQMLRGLIASTAGASMPMSMIVIGATLGPVSLLDAFRKPSLYAVSALRLLVAPLITWLVCRMLTADPVLLMTCVIISGSPSGVLVTVLCVQYGKDAVYSAEGTLQNTALSLLTIPLLVWLLG